MKPTRSILLSLLALFGAAIPAPADDVIRIKAGLTAPLTDESGVVWQADKGFAGGDIIERPDIAVANTKTPSIYRSERYSMSAFRRQLPNGKYTVKLHFAETYEDIYAPGQRVFSFEVEGREFKDFDVWQKAGGALRAHVETVEVEVTDGFLDISFTHKIENPQICALEIIAQR
jgi:endoglucanase